MYWLRAAFKFETCDFPGFTFQGICVMNMVCMIHLINSLNTKVEWFQLSCDQLASYVGKTLLKLLSRVASELTRDQLGSQVMQVAKALF